jgi:hypothetical protein
VPGERIELSRSQGSRDFKSLASTNSATQARIREFVKIYNMFEITCQYLIAYFNKSPPGQEFIIIDFTPFKFFQYLVSLHCVSRVSSYTTIERLRMILLEGRCSYMIHNLPGPLIINQKHF